MQPFYQVPSGFHHQTSASVASYLRVQGVNFSRQSVVGVFVELHSAALNPISEDFKAEDVESILTTASIIVGDATAAIEHIMFTCDLPQVEATALFKAFTHKSIKVMVPVEGGFQIPSILDYTRFFKARAQSKARMNAWRAGKSKSKPAPATDTEESEEGDDVKFLYELPPGYDQTNPFATLWKDRTGQDITPKPGEKPGKPLGQLKMLKERLEKDFPGEGREKLLKIIDHYTSNWGPVHFEVKMVKGMTITHDGPHIGTMLQYYEVVVNMLMQAEKWEAASEKEVPPKPNLQVVK